MSVKNIEFFEIGVVETRAFKFLAACLAGAKAVPLFPAGGEEREGSWGGRRLVAQNTHSPATQGRGRLRTVP